MRIGLGCCCEIPSGVTGLYDMYGVDDNIFSPVGFTYPSFLWYRNTSCPPSFTLTPHLFPLSIHPPFCWYVDLRTSGNIQYGYNDFAISPNDYTDDKCWIMRNDSYGETQLWRSYNDISNSVWATGTGAIVSGNQLLSKFSGFNSGLYIRQTASPLTGDPDLFGTYYNIFVEIPPDYQKNILFKLPGFIENDGFYVWINNTGTTTSMTNAITTFNGTGIPFAGEQPIVGKDTLCDRYFYTISDIPSYDRLLTGSNIEVRLVNDLGGFSFSGASGEGTTIYSLSMAVDDSVGGVPTHSIGFSTGSSFRNITLINNNTKTPITIHQTKTNQYFSEVTGSDMGRYSHLTGVNFTGQLWSEHNLLELTRNDDFAGRIFLLNTMFPYKYHNFNNHYYGTSQDIITAFTLPRAFGSRFSAPGNTTFGDFLLQAPGIPTLNFPERLSGFVSSYPTVSNANIHNASINRSGTKIAFTYLGDILENELSDVHYDINDKQYQVQHDDVGTSLHGLFNYDYIFEIDSLRGSGSGLTINGLQGHWPLQDTANDTNIVALVGPQGNISGGRTASEMTVDGPGGIYPRALAFDGDGDYIHMVAGSSIFASCTGMTMMLWMNRTGNPAAGIMYVSNSTSNLSPRMTMAGAGVSGENFEIVHENDGESQVPINLTSGSWQHVAATIDLVGNTIKTYNNGNLITSTGFSSLDDICDAGVSLRVRLFAAGPNNQQAPGQGAGARMYSGILSPEQIAEIYDFERGVQTLSGIISPTGETRLYWGERYNWGQIESDTFITGRLDGAVFNSGPIGNLAINLPRVQLMSAKDYPNCWSVLYPIQKLYAEDTTVFQIGSTFYTPTMQIETIADTVQILYGPITGNNYPIYLEPNSVATIQSGTVAHSNTFYQTGAGDNRVFLLNRHVLHGDLSGSTVFWEDTHIDDRLVYGFINTSGQLIRTTHTSEAVANANAISGLMVNTIPTCSASVLWGDVKYTASGVVGSCIFTHNTTTTTIFDEGNFPYYSGTASETGYAMISGTSYIKVKIGDSIVLDKQIYSLNQTRDIDNIGWSGFEPPPSIIMDTDYDDFPGFSLEMARGLSAIETTESSQNVTRVTGTGSGQVTITGVSFGWFERLWHTEPTYQNITGHATGWRLHVCNISGQDLWTLDSMQSKYLTTSGWGTGQIVTVTTGSPFGTGNMGNLGIPTIMGSSDRFIYVNGFFLCDRKVGYIDEHNNTSGALYVGLTTAQQTDNIPPISGGGWSWAISHDGNTRFPIKVDGRQFARTMNVFGDTTAGDYEDNPHELPRTMAHLGGAGTYVVGEGANNNVTDQASISDFVKHVNVIPHCPAYEEYGANVCGGNSPIYYATTGVFIVTGGAGV